MAAPRLGKLRHFIYKVGRLYHEHHQAAPPPDAVTQRLAVLVCYDGWLPEEYTLPHPHHYQQYLLYTGSGEHFSTVSFVWGPGQAASIHDHQVRGAIGMLRGVEGNQRYQLDADDVPRALGVATLLEAGQVEEVSIGDGDIHHVSSAPTGRTSISIHIYGGNIGVVRYAAYTPEGQQEPSVFGYSNRHSLDIWGLSHEY